ncbi:MAG: glycosyltransferase [Candidatus Omnitrophota bacterium]|nr:glycosyltransferase [Candidatus Omnitrophota bacterium]MDZ4242863.1 glycosyltransferase [Candidatus Omnitrophota bacterium]
MKVSGFTIVRNAVKYNYPALESIRSILPVCDEFIVNVGESEDDTLGLIRSLRDPKVRVIQTKWDFSEGKTVLSRQTNIALKECAGDWAFYLQSDEVIHEDDLPRLHRVMEKHLTDEQTDALRFSWLHFYGSYYRYRVDHGWYQKQDRIVRNNGRIESIGDAWGFGRKDGQDLRRRNTGCLLYHYGWVHSGDVMTRRRVNAEQIGFTSLKAEEREGEYSYGDLNRFPPYFGSHPAVMKARVAVHALSREDYAGICRRYWWHPGHILNLRMKTWKREKGKIE